MTKQEMETRKREGEEASRKEWAEERQEKGRKVEDRRGTLRWEGSKGVGKHGEGERRKEQMGNKCDN